MTVIVVAIFSSLLLYGCSEPIGFRPVVFSFPLHAPTIIDPIIIRPHQGFLIPNHTFQSNVEKLDTDFSVEVSHGLYGNLRNNSIYISSPSGNIPNGTGYYITITHKSSGLKSKPSYFAVVQSGEIISVAPPDPRAFTEIIKDFKNNEINLASLEGRPPIFNLRGYHWPQLVIDNEIMGIGFGIIIVNGSIGRLIVEQSALDVWGELMPLL